MPSQFGGVALDDNQPSGAGSRFGGVPVGDNDQKPDTSFVSNYGQSFLNAANEGRIGLEGLGQSVGKALYGANPQDDSEQASRQAELDKIRSETAKSGVEPSGVAGTLGSVAGSIAGNPTSWTPLGEINGIGDLAKAGAKIGGLSGAVENTDDNSIWDHLLNAGKGAGEGALASAALGKGGQALAEIPGGVVNRVKGALADSAEDIASQSDKNWEDASNLFKSSTANGATINDSSAQTILGKVKAAVGNLTSRHSDTANTLSDFEATLQKGNVTPDDLHDFRKYLNDVIKENTKSKIDGGGINEDGQKAMAAKNALDEALSGLGQKDLSAGTPQAISDLQNGINSTARAYHYDRVANMLKDAGGDPNTIMRGAAKLLKNTNGMNDDEIAALNDLATRGTGQSIERALGTFGLDWGKTKNMALPVLAADAAKAGGAAYVPGGVPLVTAGTVLRQTGKWAVKGKGQNLLDTIMERDTAPPATGGHPLVSKFRAGMQSSAPVSTSVLPNIEAKTASQQAQEKLETQSSSSSIGNENMQELQQLKQSMPQGNAVPDVKSFVKAESSGDPNAKNPNSSASGLYQFTNKTWNDMVARYGKQTGIGFGDKANPQAQATMAALYAKDNIASLQNTLGRLPTKGELYMAHVLGAHGAATLLKADPNKEAIMLFPRQVFDANHNLFFSGRTPRTVGQVQQMLTEKVS